MRIVLFGQSGAELTQITQGVLYADGYDYKLFPGGDTLGWLRKMQPDLLVSAGYTKILPQEALDIPRLGGINIHPSLLPDYKGSYPVFWAFFDGRTEIGLTVHAMVADVDAGDILAQVRLPVDPGGDPVEAYAELCRVAIPVLGAALRKIADTGVVAGDPQPSGGCTRLTPWRELDRLAFDWSLPAAEIVRRFRAFPDWMNIPHRGRVFVRRAALAEADGGPSQPGAVLARGLDSIVVRAGDGQAVRLEGLRRRRSLRGATSRPRSLLLPYRLPDRLLAHDGSPAAGM